MTQILQKEQSNRAQKIGIMKYHVIRLHIYKLDVNINHDFLDRYILYIIKNFFKLKLSLICTLKFL